AAGAMGTGRAVRAQGDRAGLQDRSAVPPSLGDHRAGAPGARREGKRGIRACADRRLHGAGDQALLRPANGRALVAGGRHSGMGPAADGFGRRHLCTGILSAPMMSDLVHASQEALSEGGALASHLDAFVPRPAQLCLTGAIAETLQQRDLLLAEAGTGTGKTYAYLVPVLLSGLRTIISTGTRALQDQLYHRDLPRVRQALGVGHRSALLKGRANYLCRYRLQQARGEPRFSSPQQAAEFQRILAWSGRTRHGDMAEMEALADDSPLLPMVTSTVDNCLGTECPSYDDCFVVQARQRAQAADLVVVNHHLLLADLALKQDGFGELLPGAQAFVIDEAHQLPELAAQFFGEGFGARMLVELGRDSLRECREVPGALAVLQHPAMRLEQAVRGLRAEMDALPVRGTRERALQPEAVGDAF